MADTDLPTKAELLARIDESWNRFNAYLDSLTEAQLTEPTDAAGWTAKDHVIHLAVWEDGIDALLERKSRPGRMGLDDETFMSGDFDRMNAVIQKQHKDRLWAEVRQIFHDTHQRLMQKVRAMSEDELRAPYNHYAPESTRTAAVVNWIISDTYEHYEDHQPWIDAIVNRAG